MTDIRIPISDNVYKFISRYYTNGNEVGLNLLLAIQEKHVIPIGKNFKLSDQAEIHLEKYLAKERDEYEDYSDI